MKIPTLLANKTVRFEKKRESFFQKYAEFALSMTFFKLLLSSTCLCVGNETLNSNEFMIGHC